ncbi:Uncharacterised protein [Segatella copri]|nr:Uncharacterised protein [Segatella copri]
MIQQLRVSHFGYFTLTILCLFYEVLHQIILIHIT